jgi:glycosyltransferase involved in cell wall biosynthesis
MFAKGIVAAYLLRDKGVDMLHTHFAAWPGAATVVAADLLGVSFSVTAGHGYDLYTPSTLLEFVVRHAAAVVTVAEQRRRAILQRCSELSVEDIPIIPCSIDVANFPLIEREETDIIRLLSVGRLIEPKGHEYLIQACAKLRERNIKFHCTIVGSGSVQAEQKLQRLVASLDLRKEISLAGALTFRDILELYQTHDIFVMPCVVAQDNTRDGTPVVFVEAAATGLPLISTPIGGIPEIVVDSVTGLLVPERNAVAVADAISELSGSLERRQYLGLSGRRLVEQKFDSISNANRLIEMFRRIAIRVSGVSE